MAGEILTAGAALGYRVETAAGTRPTAGYINMPGVKSIPDFNTAPATHQVTDLSDTTHHRSIPGLIDVGGEMAFGFNFTTQMRTAWRTMVTAFETAQAAGMSMWFAVTHEQDTEAYYFTGQPMQLGLPAHEVDTPREIDGYIIPNRIEGWAIKPTTTP